MKKILYKLIKRIIKNFAKGDIVAKEFSHYTKKLYYERSEHLIFLFQNSIRYEEEIQDKLNKYIKQGDLIFDIGGNIGQYAIPFSELVGKNGKVISIEPDIKNFSFLQFNMNINNCNNVVCLNCGIGNNENNMVFFRDTETGGRMGTFKKEYVGTNFNGDIEIVNVIKFDTLISKFGVPSFVKIDVEGFENEVLEGLTLNFQNCIFLIEVREETKNNVFNFFIKNDYKCFCVDEDDIQINKESEIPSFANLIFMK